MLNGVVSSEAKPVEINSEETWIWTVLKHLSSQEYAGDLWSWRHFG